MTQLSNLDTSIQSPGMMMPVPEPAAPPFPTVHRDHGFAQSKNEKQSTSSTSPQTDESSSEKKDNTFVPPPHPHFSSVSIGHNASNYEIHNSTFTFVNGNRRSVTMNVDSNGGGSSPPPPPPPTPTGFGSSFRNKSRALKPNKNPVPKFPQSAFSHGGMAMGASTRIQNTTTTVHYTESYSGGRRVSTHVVNGTGCTSYAHEYEDNNSDSPAPSTPAAAPADDNDDDDDNRFAAFGGDKFGNNASGFTITNGCFTNSNGKMVVNSMCFGGETSTSRKWK